MARPKSAAVAVRNDQIYAMFKRGASLADLAAEFKITPPRVGQVVAAFHPEGQEDDDRALFRGCLWRLYDEVEGMIAEPGYKLSPQGGPARGPDGEPALDMNTRIQAGELQLKVITELRKLDSRDRPQKSHVTHELAQQQASEALAAVAAQRDAERREMEALRRNAGVVPGEVIRELPPA